MYIMKPIHIFTILIILLLLVACKPDPKPRLLVFIALDHLAYHTYDHYRPVFNGGLKWLDDHGVSFENIHHEHGYTSTGPGHFVLGSGLYPGPVGVLGNSWWDRIQKKDVYCVDDPDSREIGIPSGKVSYDKINATSFGDWLKAASPESKVYSVACKDRAAIMMGGKHPDLAIWYNWQGSFTTSSYYTKAIPAWLTQFNSENDFLRYRDSIWTPSLPEADYLAYTHADSFYGESDRYLTEPYSPVFPIGFEPQWDDSKIYGEMGGRPWMDRIILDLALTTIKENQLGQDNRADVISLGLSTMDLIAHYYGPYSRETMDHLIKLDQYLMTFFQRLDEQIGLENIVFAMGTDHGGMSLPEHWTAIEGHSGGRVDEQIYLAARVRAYSEIDSLYGNHDFIHRKGSSYFFDFVQMDSLQVDAALVTSILQSRMEAVEGVHRLYTKDELLHVTDADPLKRRLNRMMNPILSPDIITLEDYGWMFRNPYGTTHGTPYEYDSHVPFLIAHQDLQTIRLDDSVSTVDIAPTLGAILGVEPINPIDGRSLLPLIPGNGIK